MPKLGAGRLFFEVFHGVGKKSFPGNGRKESKAVGGSSDEDPYSLTGRRVIFNS